MQLLFISGEKILKKLEDFMRRSG